MLDLSVDSRSVAWVRARGAVGLSACACVRPSRALLILYRRFEPTAVDVSWSAATGHGVEVGYGGVRFGRVWVGLEPVEGDEQILVFLGVLQEFAQGIVAFFA